MRTARGTGGPRRAIIKRQSAPASTLAERIGGGHCESREECRKEERKDRTGREIEYRIKERIGYIIKEE
jgi:hypothetical protein